MLNQDVLGKQIRIKNIVNQLTYLKKELADLKMGCRHNIMTAQPDGKLSCDICGEELGWECSYSPDHGCHYFTEFNKENGRTITLRNKEIYRMPLNHYCSAEESLKQCIFCSKPYAR